LGENELDLELVKRVQRGDKTAFDLLVRKYQHRIGAVIGRFVPDHAEAQDIAQESFIRAYARLGNFRGDSQFYTWLYRIAVNTAKNHLVAMKRRPPTSDVEADDAEHYAGAGRMHDHDTPEHELLREEIAREVSRNGGRAARGTAPGDHAARDGRPVLRRDRRDDGLPHRHGAVAIFRAREAIDARLRPLMESQRVRP
jgi:RNA polymerase sigma-70 factor (ECF subfamily)